MGVFLSKWDKNALYLEDVTEWFILSDDGNISNSVIGVHWILILKGILLRIITSVHWRVVEHERFPIFFMETTLLYYTCTILHFTPALPHVHCI